MRPRSPRGYATSLAVRTRYRIATSVQIDVPDVSDKAMLVMVHELDTARCRSPC
jgi:hypothetical protein